MLSFGQPSYLYLLAALPLAAALVAWAARRRNADLGRIGDAQIVQHLHATVNRGGRRARTVLWFVSLALVLIALARPQWGTGIEKVEQRGVQLMFALDISTSMLAEDAKPNRLARAKLEIMDLISRLEGDDVGLVLFSGAAFIQFPLTFDYNTARTFLENAHPGMISRQGTAIADAIDAASQGFDEQRLSQKVLVVLTDGENHEGNAVAAAERAADAGVIVYTVGLGSPQGEPIPDPTLSNGAIHYKRDQRGQIVLSRLDEPTLREIAMAGNGRYFSPSAVLSPAEALATEISGLQTATVQSELDAGRIERFQIFLYATLLALVVFELIPDRARSRLLPGGPPRIREL
jgi:Ca-activated chloride channel family protein